MGRFRFLQVLVGGLDDANATCPYRSGEGINLPTKGILNMTADTASATGTVAIDNERVRVTHWHIPVGAATGHHRHAYDYVIVPVSAGRMLLKEATGDRFFDLTPATPYFKGEGVEHDVVNAGDIPIHFIEIELK